MTDYEATMLAGVPNAPSVYAPTKNLELAKQRQEQVLDSMVRFNTITKREAEEILEEGDETDERGRSSSVGRPLAAQGFPAPKTDEKGQSY